MFSFIFLTLLLRGILPFLSFPSTLSLSTYTIFFFFYLFHPLLFIQSPFSSNLLYFFITTSLFIPIFLFINLLLRHHSIFIISPFSFTLPQLSLSPSLPVCLPLFSIFFLPSYHFISPPPNTSLLFTYSSFSPNLPISPPLSLYTCLLTYLFTCTYLTATLPFTPFLTLSLCPPTYLSSYLSNLPIYLPAYASSLHPILTPFPTFLHPFTYLPIHLSTFPFSSFTLTNYKNRSNVFFFLRS